MRHSLSINQPIQSVLGGSEHHRRINSVKSRQDSMYTTPIRTSPKAGPSKARHTERVNDTSRMAAWKYPKSTASSPNSSIDASRNMSPSASTESSPSTSPDTSAQDWQDFKHSTGSPPRASTRASGHRFSPSLPYAQFSNAQSASSHQSRFSQSSRVRTQSNTTASVSHARRNTVSYHLLGISRVMVNGLRRSRPIEMLYGFVFFSSLLVFAGALAGIGYVPPPAELVTLAPEVVIASPIAAIAPAIKVPSIVDARVRPEMKAIDLPKHVEPLHGLDAQASEIVIRENDDEEQLPEWARHYENADDEPVVHRRPVHAADDDWVRDSPADAHLDEQHAAHVHHPTEENIYERAPEGHSHHHDHEYKLELVDGQYKVRAVDDDSPEWLDSEVEYEGASEVENEEAVMLADSQYKRMLRVRRL